MSLTVKNIGPLNTMFGGATTSKWYSGNREIKSNAATYGEVGTVRVVYLSKEYVFGPLQSITFADNGIGTAVAAIDARLSVIAKS